jgi:hypothetical protein
MDSSKAPVGAGRGRESWWIGARTTLVTVCVLGGIAAAEPKATKVEIKPFRDELIVLADREGGIYAVKPRKDGEDARLWYGANGKELYEQTATGYSADGASWSIPTWAPRVSGMRPAYFALKKDGTYAKWCDVKDETLLTQLTGEKAKAVLDKASFLTEFMVRRAHVLARDDSGVYYYVDRLARAYGGKGYRVFVGKKGALKQLALTDVASDSGGEVFSTKTGDLRLVRTVTDNSAERSQITWVRGGKRHELISLDVEVNATVIWSELGVYKFLGTLCDHVMGS